MLYISLFLLELQLYTFCNTCYCHTYLQISVLDQILFSKYFSPLFGFEDFIFKFTNFSDITNLLLNREVLIFTITFFSPRIFIQFSSVQSLSCVQLFATPINCSTPGLPVQHKLPEFTQTHVHPVGDAIQPSHPLSSPSPPALNPSQHQHLFQ